MAADEMPEAQVDAGPQQATPSDTALPVLSDLSDEGVSGIIVGLAESKARSMGSEPVARLVAGHIQQLTTQLATTNRELRQTRSELDLKREELGSAKQDLALARQELRHVRGESNVHLILHSFGLILIGVAIQLFQSNLDRPGWLVGVLGIAMVIGGLWRKYWRAKND